MGDKIFLGLWISLVMAPLFAKTLFGNGANALRGDIASAFLAAGLVALTMINLMKQKQKRENFGNTI